MKSFGFGCGFRDTEKSMCVCVCLTDVFTSVNDSHKGKTELNSTTCLGPYIRSLRLKSKLFISQSAESAVDLIAQ